MGNGKFGSFDDAFEQAMELGKASAKASIKQIKQTFDPKKLAERAVNQGQLKTDKGMERPEKNMKKPDHTPLDFQKLEQQYASQDKAKHDALANRLFQMVKQGDERVSLEKKQKEQEDKRRQAYEEEEKKRRKQQQAQQPAAAPQGKSRRSIFSHKKVAQREQTEVKANTGKQ